MPTTLHAYMGNCCTFYTHLDAKFLVQARIKLENKATLATQGMRSTSYNAKLSLPKCLIYNMANCNTSMSFFYESLVSNISLVSLRRTKNVSAKDVAASRLVLDNMCNRECAPWMQQMSLEPVSSSLKCLIHIRKANSKHVALWQLLPVLWFLRSMNDAYETALFATMELLNRVRAWPQHGCVDCRRRIVKTISPLNKCSAQSWYLGILELAAGFDSKMQSAKGYNPTSTDAYAGKLKTISEPK